MKRKIEERRIVTQKAAKVDEDDLMRRAADMANFDDEDDGSDDESVEKEASVAAERSVAKRSNKRRADPVDRLRRDAAMLEHAPRTTGIQLQELLRSVRVPSASSSKSVPLQDFIDLLERTLKALPARAPVSVAAAVKSVPFPNAPSVSEASKLQWKLAFEPPTSVQVVGSRATSTVCRWKGVEGWTVDVAVEMPASLFQEKDIKDHRYLHKRSFYAAVLAKHLRDIDAEVSLGILNGDVRKPTVELRPRTGSAHDFSKLRCVVRLLPCYALADAPWTAARLEPSKCNIRHGGSEAPTPEYNASILTDGTLLSTAAHLQSVGKSCSSFAETATLLKVWTRQRGLQQEHSLASIDHIITMILAHLVSPALNRAEWRLSPSLGIWQLFKGVIEFLARHDLAQHQFFMGESEVASKRFADVMPAFVDPTGALNLLTGVRPAACQLLHDEARATARVLNGDSLAGFEAALIRPVTAPASRFDVFATVQLPTTPSVGSPDASSSTSALVARLSSVLSRALGTRIRCLSLALGDGNLLGLGIRTKGSEALRLVDLGPPAEDEAGVREFSQFWGAKSELRRFKDGAIREAVVWDIATPLDRSGLIGIILRYLLCDSPHFSFDSSSVQVLDAVSFADLIREPAAVRVGPSYTEDPEIKAFGGVITAYNELGKALRAVQGLPLSITNVAASAEALRYTSIYVPGPKRRKGWASRAVASQHLSVHELIITFESSGRWPDELEAVQKIKAAMLAKLGERLLATDSSSGVAQAEVAFDVDELKTADNVSLELLLRSGFAFRVRIHHDRERVLLERAIALPSTTPAARRLAQKALFAHETRFAAATRHHNAISTIHHRYTGFALATRIFKRWLSAHLLSPHVSAEWAELVVASAFLGPADDARPLPSSGSAGFARALERLREWRWRDEPLLAPVYSAAAAPENSTGAVQVPSEVRQKAIKSFEEQRRTDPAIHTAAMIVATEADPSGRSLDWSKPDRMIAARLQVLASATLDAIERGGPGLDVKTLFTTPLDHYDFVLHLDRTVLSRYSQNIDPDVKTLARSPVNAQAESAPITLDYDPVQSFVERAVKALGDAVVLFHDACGGEIVAGLLHPTTTRDWRPHITFPCQPVAEGQVQLDRQAVIADLCRLSDGLVVSVTVRS